MSESPFRLAVALNGYGLERWGEDGGHRDILPWEELKALGGLSEELGYERIFLPEIGGREAFSTLAGFGASTTRIGLATGVIRLSSRELFTTGMGASSVDEMTGGRLVLGVGSSESIDRTRQLVNALREELAGGEGVVSDPDTTWATGQLSWFTAPRRVPIYLAALGPRMAALAGEVADGMILNWCTPSRVAEASESVSRAEGFQVVVYVRACLSHVDEHALEALKVAAARYAAMPPYSRQLRSMGLGREASAAVDGLGRDGHPRDVVPDSLIEALCVWGEREGALRRLREYSDAGADVVVVYPVPAGEAVSSLTGTLMAAAPEPALEA